MQNPRRTLIFLKACALLLDSFRTQSIRVCKSIQSTAPASSAAMTNYRGGRLTCHSRTCRATSTVRSCVHNPDVDAVIILNLAERWLRVGD